MPRNDLFFKAYSILKRTILKLKGSFYLKTGLPQNDSHLTYSQAESNMPLENLLMHCYLKIELVSSC